MFSGETVYSNEGSDEDGHVMSDRVQKVATNVYKEFERMIPTYGEDVVKEMMPHIVNILEFLDQSFKENQEKEAELELCKDDNEQLMRQYEREKQLRKSDNQRLMAMEDGMEEERKEMDRMKEEFQLNIKALELKNKNFHDHVVRLEEKESELKKEFNKVHDRYTDLLKKHMESVEKSKVAVSESLYDPVQRNLPMLRSVCVTKSNRSEEFEYDPLNQNIMTDSFHNIGVVDMLEKNINTDHVDCSEAGTFMSALSPLGEAPPKGNKKKIIKPIKQEVDSIENTDDDDDDDDDDDFLGQIVNPADFSSTGGDNYFGMSKEIENLILENTELLSTKNALNVLKDDLISKLEDSVSEQELLKEELKALSSLKEKLRQHVVDLEAEVKKMKEEAGKHVSTPQKEDELSMAQRKRFTRVEMARVLMERNQYKERLMELQEAVRWTEMVRASRDHPDLLPGSHHPGGKKKSSLWNYFERLFSRRADPPRRVSSLASVRYNAPTSPRRDRSRSQRQTRVKEEKKEEGRTAPPPSSSSPSLSTLDPLPPDHGIIHNVQLPHHTTNQHVSFDEVSHNNQDAANEKCAPINNYTSMTSSCNKRILPAPTPTYCRPFSHDSKWQLWCAAISHHNQAWICTSNQQHSRLVVCDVISPCDVIASFDLEDEQLLCIHYVACDAMEIMGEGTKIDYKEDDEEEEKKEEKSETEGKIREDISTDTNDAAKTDDKPGDEGVKESDVVSGSSEVEVRRLKTKFYNESEGEGSSADGFEGLKHASVWVGSQKGRLYIYNTDSKERVVTVDLKQPIFNICCTKDRVFLALANDTLVVFCRNTDNMAWELGHHYSIKLGLCQNSIKCLCIVPSQPPMLWCSYRNYLYIFHADSLRLHRRIEAHPRPESQIRQMVHWRGGVWINIRLDSTLRLFHASTYQHLQDVDVEPYVSKMLGTGKLGFSFIRITCMMASRCSLWVGTANGVVLCVPLLPGTSGHTEAIKSGVYTQGRKEGDAGIGGQGSCVSTCIIKRLSREVGGNDIAHHNIPFCSISQAQLSFHGFKGAVKFFVSTHHHEHEDKKKDDNRDSDFDEDSISRKSDDEKDDVFDTDNKRADEGAISDDDAETSKGAVTNGGAVTNDGTGVTNGVEVVNGAAIEEKATHETKPSGDDENKDDDVSMVMAGGEGYVDFRFGPATSMSMIENEDESNLANKISEGQVFGNPLHTKNNLSHLIVWQVANQKNEV